MVVMLADGIPGGAIAGIAAPDGTFSGVGAAYAMHDVVPLVGLAAPNAVDRAVG